MDWEATYRQWAQLWREHKRERAHALLADARAGLRENERADWEWLNAALADEGRKWFVAALFGRLPLPRRLLAAMIRAAVHEPDASHNRRFVEPCVATYGKERVRLLLSEYVESGTEQEKRGAEKALYWLGVKVPGRGFLPQRRT